MAQNKTPKRRFAHFNLGLLIGIPIGIGAAVIIVGMLLFQNIASSISEISQPTATLTPAPTFTPTTEPTVTPTPYPSEYYQFLDNFDEEAMFINPAATIHAVELAMEGISNDLDRAAGYRLIAYAQWLSNDYAKVEGNYQKVVDLVRPQLSSLSNIQDLIRAYALLVEADFMLNDYERAVQTFADMENTCLPRIDEFSKLSDQAWAYATVVKAASWSSLYSDVGVYYRQMQTNIEPHIEAITDPLEAGRTYTYLIHAASSLYEIEDAERYAQEMIDYLSTATNNAGLSDKDKMTLYQYLGDSEKVLGHFQIAAVYYKEITNLEMNTQTIYQLAYTYGIGGVHGCAHYWYQRLLNFEEKEGTSHYTEWATARIEDIEEVFGEDTVPPCP